MAYEEVFSRLKGVRDHKRYYTAICPAHDDRKQSLSLRVAEDKLVLKCHSGCTFLDILRALGLPPGAFFMETETRQRPESKIVATYDYRDADGNLRFQVVRFDPKDFRQRTKDAGGEWRWGLNGQQPIPYNLPLIASAGDRVLIVVEGEKAVDWLTRFGFLATCSPMGAGKWRPDYADMLLPRTRVAIIPDNDEPGRSHAKQVLESLSGKVPLVRVVELPGLPEKADVWDWLQTHEPSELKALIGEAMQATPVKIEEMFLKMNRGEQWLTINRLLKVLESPSPTASTGISIASSRAISA